MVGAWLTPSVGLGNAQLCGQGVRTPCGVLGQCPKVFSSMQWHTTFLVK